MDMSDVWKLAHLLRQNGDKVLNEGSKLTLTATLLQKLNDAFLTIVDREDSRTLFQVLPAGGDDDLFHNLLFLHDFVQKVLALKVEQNLPSPRAAPPRSCILNVAKFKSLRYLELRKVPIHNVTGLQGLRPQLQAIVCVQSLRRLEDLLCACGGDQSGDFPWGELHEAVLSHNSIVTLDASLSLAPFLQVLDLSHNGLRSGEGLERLPCLRYLNLGYNCLVDVPLLCREACTRLQILILKNNFIESATGLTGLENLMELDLSWNFITSQESLWPLGDMSALSLLWLEGNPLCYCPEYRIRLASSLHTNTVFNQFVLDGVPLTKLEKMNLGTAAKSDSIVASSQLPEKQEVTSVQQTSMSSGPGKLQRGKKSSRVREVVISEHLDTDEKKTIAPAASPSTSLDASDQEHLQTKRQVEELRERFGKEDWLHNLGGSCLQDVLGMEKTAPPDLSATLRHCLDDADTLETTMDSPCRGDSTYTASVGDHQPSGSAVAVDLVAAAPEKMPSEDSLQKALLSEVSAAEEPQAHSSQETQEEEVTEEADDDVGDVKLYLVQKHRPGVDILDEMFLVLTESHIKERDAVSGKTREKWALDTLLSCTKTSNDPVTLQLTFDTVRRDRQERFYIMDEEDAEQLLRALGQILDSRSLAAMNQVVFRCLRCQSQFTQELAPHVATHPDSQSTACPACDSTAVIIADEVPLPSNLSVAHKGPLKDAAAEGTAPAMIKCPSECSIGLQSGGAETLQVTAVVHNNPCSPVDCAPRLLDAKPSSAASLNPSPERLQEGTATMRRCESDIEIISNPSQSSIEVLDDTGRVRGHTPARKSSHEEKQAGVVAPELSSVKGVIMTESSSSGSLADSICTAYENLPEVATSDLSLPLVEGDSGLPLPKATGGVDSVRVPSASESSDDTLEGADTKAGLVGSLPEVGVTYTSVLEDLLQSVTLRLPPVPGLQPTGGSTTGGGIQYSYSDFADVDHRVKLHLYVHVFGDQEQLVLLLKARVIRQHGVFPYLGCVVFSTFKIYLLQITGLESDEPQDWLRLEDSWPAGNLKAVSTLPSEQGVSLELSSPPTCVLAVLQYGSRTAQFLEFLSGLSLTDRYNFTISGTSDRHELLIQQLTLSMPSDDDPDLALHHFVIFSHCVVRRGTEHVKALRVGVLVLTGSALLLTDDNVDWLFPGSSTVPEPAFTQSMSSLVELELEGLCLTLHFLDESTQSEESWVVAVDSREMVDALTDSVRSLWEDLFSVPLQVVDRNKHASE